MYEYVPYYKKGIRFERNQYKESFIVTVSKEK